MLALVGGIVGLILGLIEFAFFRALAKRVQLEETRRALRISGAIQVVFFPVVGFFLVPAIFGE